jgi:hypothetical protein
MGADCVDDFSNEPAIKDRATLETQLDRRRVVDDAAIANLTAAEIWVVVGESAVGHFRPGSTVQLVVVTSHSRSLAADTSVTRLVGGSGRMIALGRPATWTSSSRRANGRVRLAIPAYLRPDTDGTVASARTTNISVGGFHCITDLPVSVGDQMAVSLMFTPTDSFECRAQIVRLSDDPDDPTHHRLVAALRFVDLTAADEVRVAEALTALSTDTDATALPLAWHGGVASRGRTG